MVYLFILSFFVGVGYRSSIGISTTSLYVQVPQNISIKEEVFTMKLQYHSDFFTLLMSSLFLERERFKVYANTGFGIGFYSGSIPIYIQGQKKSVKANISPLSFNIFSIFSDFLLYRRKTSLFLSFSPANITYFLWLIRLKNFDENFGLGKNVSSIVLLLRNLDLFAPQLFIKFLYEDRLGLSLGMNLQVLSLSFVSEQGINRGVWIDRKMKFNLHFFLTPSFNLLMRI